MTDAAALAQLRASLAGAGGYLRNILHEPNVTCATCATPVGESYTGESYTKCYRCYQDGYHSGSADLVGSMIYAIDGTQSGRLMYGYKSAAPGPSHRQIVSSLVVLGIREHKTCANKLLGVPATSWATIPSLRKIGSEHPFRKILTDEIAPGAEITVQANPPIVSPREIVPSNYQIASPVTIGSHVMVIDDTWTSGGHAHSVSAALKAAGAGKVSILTVARWLVKGDDGSPQRKILFERIAPRPYDPAGCPWTGGTCP